MNGLRRRWKRMENASIGTKIDNPEIIETVIRKGTEIPQEKYDQRQSLQYRLLADYRRRNKIAGMLFIGSDRAIIEKASRHVITTILISVIAVGLLMVAAGYLLPVPSRNPCSGK